MKPKKRQKMCYNCEGEVDLDVIVCPFCAADLRAEKPELLRSSYNPTASVKNLSTQQSLYPPSFASKALPSVEDAEPSPELEMAAQAPAESEEEKRSIFGPVALLTLGAQLLLFGLLMLLFSENGFLTLRWDARFWFLYAFASIPLLIFGYRSLSKL